jgi:hypothetical protein
MMRMGRAVRRVVRFAAKWIGRGVKWGGERDRYGGRVIHRFLIKGSIWFNTR